MMTRPEFCTDEMLEYLDALRESGTTNMFGAGPHVEQEFDLKRRDAGAVVQYRMATFEQRHPEVSA